MQKHVCRLYNTSICTKFITWIDVSVKSGISVQVVEWWYIQLRIKRPGFDSGPGQIVDYLFCTFFLCFALCWSIFFYDSSALWLPPPFPFRGAIQFFFLLHCARPGDYHGIARAKPHARIPLSTKRHPQVSLGVVIRIWELLSEAEAGSRRSMRSS